MDELADISRELAVMVRRQESAEREVKTLHQRSQNAEREVIITREHIDRLTKQMVADYPEVAHRIAAAARRSPQRRQVLPTPAAIVSQREYARLRGVGEKVVHGAVRRKELVAPAVVGNKGRIDVHTADRQLAFATGKVSPQLAQAARTALDVEATQDVAQLVEPMVDYASIVTGLSDSGEVPPSYVDMSADELEQEPAGPSEAEIEAKRRTWLEAAGKIAVVAEPDPVAEAPAQPNPKNEPICQPEPAATHAEYAPNYSGPAEKAGGSNGATDPELPIPEQPDEPQPPVVPDLPPGQWEAPAELPPPEPSAPPTQAAAANGRMVPRISTKRREAQETAPIELPEPVKVSALGRAPIVDTSAMFDNRAIDAKRATQFLIGKGYSVIPSSRGMFRIDNGPPVAEQEMIDKAVVIMERDERMSATRARLRSGGVSA